MVMLLHVGTVLCLEEHDCGPVVRFILNEVAASTCGKRSRVLARIHGDVERIASNDLMKMGCVLHARVDERICSFNDELRAGEPQHVLGYSILRESRSDEQSSPLHRD